MPGPRTYLASHDYFSPIASCTSQLSQLAKVSIGMRAQQSAISKSDGTMIAMTVRGTMSHKRISRIGWGSSCRIMSSATCQIVEQRINPDSLFNRSRFRNRAGDYLLLHDPHMGLWYAHLVGNYAMRISLLEKGSFRKRWSTDARLSDVENKRWGKWDLKRSESQFVDIADSLCAFYIFGIGIMDRRTRAIRNT